MPACPFADGLTRVGEFSGIVLYRQAPYQVQLWLCDPNSEIPDHAHPDVDSIQLYIGGQLELRYQWKVVIPNEAIFEHEDGNCSVRGLTLRVHPGETHGATIGPKGAAFVTFQKWLKEPPKSVELNWQGDYLSKDHEANVTQTDEQRVASLL